jgi:hypothetical protein
MAARRCTWCQYSHAGTIKAMLARDGLPRQTSVSVFSDQSREARRVSVPKSSTNLVALRKVISNASSKVVYDIHIGRFEGEPMARWMVSMFVIAGGVIQGMERQNASALTATHNFTHDDGDEE